MALECKRVYGELGTVYAQCGGIFGISAFADRCMDKWMADPTLNANEAVATWHAKAQRCGFKFLVVQILGQLTGGPQRYTGRPMDEAHKHLNIGGDEWDCFMEIFNEVCAEFQLGDDLVGDLNALMVSMEFDCVVQEGEMAPPYPGPALPRCNSLYARSGGVYPIALFVDRLVDALIQDERVAIPCDGQKRNEASLKYLFTEVMCNIAGGPEVITSKSMAETRLLLPKGAWEIFIATAQVAADHFPVAVRAEIVQCLQRNKALVEDPSDDGATVPALTGNAVHVKSLQAAASGRMLSSAAIAARHAAPGAHVDARRRVMGDPRTLYGRGGGVFGLAKLADTLMEAWMADATLNANASVAKWHTSQQKYGFKFLVTQIMGYLTGGPQRYTGRSMAAAHKHLCITSAQWEAFMQDAQTVLTELGVEEGVKTDLIGILQSFRSDCTIAPGEVVPADPGRPKPATGSEGTLYYRLGGVYPIAQFVDRLVDAVLKGNKVHVDLENVEDPQSKRHAPGLKYMLTELTCNCTGGPEIVTSKGFDDAKLGVPADQWPTFLEVANEAATLWPSQLLRTSLLNALAEQKSEICIGVIEEDDGMGAEANSKMRKIEVAGFGHFEATAALDKCGGDAHKALELLTSGWSPGSPGSVSQVSTFSGYSGGCPFSGASTGAGRCPFSGSATPSNVATPQRSLTAAPPQPQLDARTAEAARALTERGIPASQIATLLQIPEASVNASVHVTEEAHVGRVLGSNLQQQLDELLTEDADLCCPISLMVLSDPVIASDGFIYEKASLEQLLKANAPSPMTRQSLQANFFPAVDCKKKALEFREIRSKELLTFADEAMAAGQKGMATEAAERVVGYINGLSKGSCVTIEAKVKEMYVKLGRPAPAIRL